MKCGISTYKVCHLTTVHTRDDTRIFQKECISLQQFGFNVSLIVSDGLGDTIDNNIKIFDLGKFGGKFFRIFYFVPKLLFKALSLKQNIYHFHDPELIPVGLILKLFRKIVIYDIHEDVPLDIQTKEWIPWYLKKITSLIFKWFENLAILFFDATITVAENMNHRYKKYNSNAYIIKNFPLFREFSTVNTNFSNRKRQVCYVGSITEVRGIFAMLKSIEKIKEPFVLGGDIRGKNLKKRIYKENGWKFTNYKGRLNRKEVSSLMNESTVGLALIQHDDNLSNGYPVKLFEYMAAGLPVVVSDFPKWREIVASAQCGIVVNQFDHQSISEAILSILNNKALAKQFSENGKKAIKSTFSWDREEKKLINLYKVILNG